MFLDQTPDHGIKAVRSGAGRNDDDQHEDVEDFGQVEPIVDAVRFIDRLVEFDSLPPGGGDGDEDDDKQAKRGEWRQEPDKDGAAVVVGLLAPLAALGLLVVILVAIVRSGRQRINLYKPIDGADRIDDWLYLPETLYAFMLILVISAGAGPYSLDALILGLLNKHVT